MKITYDKTAKAAYVSLKKGRIERTVKMNDDILFDIGKNGEIIGIEMLQVTSTKALKQKVLR